MTAPETTRATRELDAEVAERVFGYTDPVRVYSWCDEQQVSPFTVYRDRRPNDDGQEPGLFRAIHDDENVRGWVIPHYSRNITTAWQVVDTVANSLNFSLDNVGGATPDEGRWRVCIGWSDDPISVHADGDTPALAICRAALLAVAALSARSRKETPDA